MAIVVLDRDGVINVDSEHYIRNVDEWNPIPGSIDAIAALSKSGIMVAIATNQSGLSRGFFGLSELEEIHQRLYSLVEAAGGQISGIFYCPHLPEEGCECRKPKTGLLKAIERELKVSDTADRFMIGDRLSDLQAAICANYTPVLVLTGRGEETSNQLRAEVDLGQDITQYQNLHDASMELIKALGKTKQRK